MLFIRPIPSSYFDVGGGAATTQCDMKHVDPTLDNHMEAIMDKSHRRQYLTGIFSVLFALVVVATLAVITSRKMKEGYSWVS